MPHLLPLLELGEHNDRVTFPFPHHSPEILHRVHQRALGGDEVILLSVALSRSKTRMLFHLQIMCVDNNACELFQTEMKEEGTYVYKRCIDEIGKLLPSSHGENHSVKVI